MFVEALPSQRDRTLWILGSYTGFRISELLSLVLEDVWRRGRIVDFVQVERRNMKGKKRSRTVVLNPECRPALLAWIEELVERGAGPRTPLFPRLVGALDKPMSAKRAREIILAAGESLGLLNVGTHSMRKTFARAVYAATDKDIRQTQLALGHVSISSTAHYLQGMDDGLHELVRGLNLGLAKRSSIDDRQEEFDWNVTRFARRG